MEREERRCYRAFAVKDLVIPINTFKIIKLYYTELKYQSGLAGTPYNLSPSLWLSLGPLSWEFMCLMYSIETRLFCWLPKKISGDI